jgi:hypothetical protein
MDWISIACGAWLAAAVLSGLWSRASNAERSVLQRRSPGTRLRFFLPWPQRDLYAAHDAPALRGLRRRSLLCVGVFFLLPFLALLLLRGAPPIGGSGVPEKYLESIERESALKAGKAAGGELHAFPPPASTENTREEAPATKEGTRTVVGATAPPGEALSPQEKLAESRTPMQLYGTAKVHVVYEKNYEDIIGVGVDDVKPGSFWERIGARSGDIILKFNGKTVESPQATVDLLNLISRGRELQLTVRGADKKIRILEFVPPG